MNKNIDIKKVIENHQHWLREDVANWEMLRADLSGADLRGADLIGADLIGADLIGADLIGADLRGANLSVADLIGADLSEANLSGANLSGANLSEANLRGADLSGANLSEANLSEADLSGCVGLKSTVDIINCLFETIDRGIIVYKTFDGSYAHPNTWIIEPGSVITENCNPCRTTECGSGINVAPLDWVIQNYPGKPIWKCLISWEWAMGIVAPYNTDGKIRCEKLELIEIVKEGE